MIIKWFNFLSPNKTGKILSSMLPVLDLKSKHFSSTFSLWSKTCLFKVSPWIHPELCSQDPGLQPRRPPPGLALPGQMFSAEPCKSTAGSEANRFYLIFKFIHSPGYTGLCLIKRKDTRVFLISLGPWKPRVSRAKTKLTLCSQHLKAVHSLEGRRESFIYLIDESDYISFFDCQFIVILCLIWKYYFAVILSCKKKRKHNL